MVSTPSTANDKGGLKRRAVRLLSDRWPRLLSALRAGQRHIRHIGSRERVFTAIYRYAEWQSGGETRSGSGSTLAETRAIRGALPRLIGGLEVRTLLDVPCGDLNWMSAVLPELALDQYIGADIVSALIEDNQRRFATEHTRFVHLDVVRDPLPHADLVLCRDLLVHLPLKDSMRVIDNVKASGATWLLATTFPEVDENTDCGVGDWRPLNLARLPFELGRPSQTLNEACVAVPDKSLGLWRLNSVRTALSGV